MVILVDMDDTIEHLLVPWLDWLNDKHGKSVHEADVISWHMKDSYPDLTEEEIFAPLYGEKFWDTVTPIEGASEALQRLMSRGHQIYIVTATPYQGLRAKMERVLFRYFPFLTWDQVIVTTNKQMIKADVMIDDGYHNLVGGDYMKILVDAPYNRKYNEQEDGMIRVYNWAEIERIIEELERPHETD